MTLTDEPDLSTLADEAAENLAEDPALGYEIPAEAGEAEVLEPDAPLLRLALAMGATTVAAAIMVGGIFLGVTPRIHAAIGGILGIALGAQASRLRRAAVANAVIIGGLFAIGLVTLLIASPADIARVSSLVQEAAADGDVLRPPVRYLPGWAAIVGWLMGAVGFTAIWTATTFRKPSLALLVPVPVLGIAAISVPKSAQFVSGVVAVVLFAIGLGLLSSAQQGGEEDEKTSIGFELRRMARALPMIAVITASLFGLGKAGFLFPKPVIDPTQQPQKPKTVPLSEVQDRVLFAVSDATVRGPWRIGALDEYDNKDWRLPAFAANELDEVPRSGIVDPELTPGARATFEVKGLTGAVLPVLPNPVGIVAEGPKLDYDKRNANIRVNQGQIEAGLRYTVTAAGIPKIPDLQAVTAAVPREIRQFADIAPPPPAVQRLLDRAEAAGKTTWDKLEFTRQYVLREVTATGEGKPVSVTPDRVADMLEGTKEGSPFEIVAAQAMLARWVGVPSRIGYGFDGGDQVGTTLEVRPRHGASFLEVYFPGFKWLPIIGTPLKAKPSVGNQGEQKFDPNVVPSEDVQVRLYLPVVLPVQSVFADNVRRALLIGIPILLLLALIYATWPALRKAIARSRRRNRANALGLAARIANAYAEWRDYCTDYGYRFDADTPLLFLERFPDDTEHSEFAWLVTRCLFGDLRERLTYDHAVAAEELSRTLRRRLAQAHPATVRAIAAVSRLSIRHPYAPGLAVLSRKERRRAEAALQPA